MFIITELQKEKPLIDKMWEKRWKELQNISKGWSETSTLVKDEKGDERVEKWAEESLPSLAVDDAQVCTLMPRVKYTEWELENDSK